ncbi:MAG: AAA family ATPase [Phycisphaerales bacterium]|nr:AAA family ATPase [Phycisphaerales bacterium]
MYLKFFQLERMPFETVPDPRFLFATPEHQEAMAALTFGVQHARGLTVVTGRAGCGKTLLARRLLETLGSQARTAVLQHPPESGRELIEGVCRGFGVRFVKTHATGELIERLQSLALSTSPSEHALAVVIDEAHRLSPETLEWVCALATMETPTARLMQLVLLGQPELLVTLNEPGLEALRQRIFCVRRVSPLDESGTRGYIDHRLRCAGARTELFTNDAVGRIHVISGGIPRVINQVADNALITAFAATVPLIHGPVVDEVCGHMMNLGLNQHAQVPIADGHGGPRMDDLGSPGSIRHREYDFRSGDAVRVKTADQQDSRTRSSSPASAAPARATASRVDAGAKRRRNGAPAREPFVAARDGKARSRRVAAAHPIDGRLDVLARGQRTLADAIAEARRLLEPGDNSAGATVAGDE